jgi:hypothetical protein
MKISDEFRELILEDKLVSAKESKDYPGYFVVKYKKKVFYDNLWSASKYIIECRGLVLDSKWNVVIRPFKKIFNYQENNSGSTWNNDTIVLTSRKVNGFMASLTNVNGKKLISTTGSLDSDFVQMASNYLDCISVEHLKPYHTYMFEIVHPLDPHIIEEKEGAHFLAVVEHDNGIIHYPFDNTFMMSLAFNDLSTYQSIHLFDKRDKVVWTFGDLLEHIKSCQHEGYVILNPKTGETIKIKSQYYLVKKFFARVGDKKLIDGIRTGTIKERIDEEYYPIIDNIHEYGVTKFLDLGEADRLILLRRFIDNIYEGNVNYV